MAECVSFEREIRQGHPFWSVANLPLCDAQKKGTKPVNSRQSQTLTKSLWTCLTQHQKSVDLAYPSINNFKGGLNIYFCSFYTYNN